MSKAKFFTSVAALAVMLTVGANSVLAYQGDYTTKGPNTSLERHEAMQNALNSTDYQAWQELMTDRGRVKEVINEENFSEFTKAWKLAQSGDYDSAEVIRQNLGLRGRDGQGTKSGYKGANGSRQGQQGKNAKSNYLDANNDGVCDNLN